MVREVAAPDVGRMGIEILSFTIKDIFDSVQYLSSLGKAQTAIVKRDAQIGVALAARDAGIRVSIYFYRLKLQELITMRINIFAPVQEAECEKSAMAVKYNTDTKIEDNSRMYKLQEANFDREINTAVSDHVLLYRVSLNSICMIHT